MIIHIYTPVWNEEKILPYYLRHYETFADKIYLYDTGSTDRTVELAKSHPQVELRSHNIGDWNRQEFLCWVKGQAFRENSRADWIIGVDCDEFVYHPYLRSVLRRYISRDITFPRVAGYQMVSETFPTTGGQIYEEVSRGQPDETYSKRVVYRSHITPRYYPGCHLCRPLGRIVESPTTELKLLHFKYLGLDYVCQRYQDLLSRVHPEVRELDQKLWSSQYAWDRPRLERRMNNFLTAFKTLDLSC